MTTFTTSAQIMLLANQDASRNKAYTAGIYMIDNGNRMVVALGKSQTKTDNVVTNSNPHVVQTRELNGALGDFFVLELISAPTTKGTQLTLNIYNENETTPKKTLTWTDTIEVLPAGQWGVSAVVFNYPTYGPAFNIDDVNIYQQETTGFNAFSSVQIVKN
jgi:hypothetical protein